MVPTGVTAVNIDSNIIHSGLGINCKGQFFPLNDLQKASLWNKLSKVSIIIIDEISMVSRKLFIELNQRLIEMVGCNKKIVFAGLSACLFVDIYFDYSL